uniref:DNA excision repair protein ERCC-6-like n=1 Tax=Denticeps clupeoides TaxID=299321 RepID=A0AAY4A114_9TELE
MGPGPPRLTTPGSQPEGPGPPGLTTPGSQPEGPGPPGLTTPGSQPEGPGPPGLTTPGSQPEGPGPPGLTTPGSQPEGPGPPGLTTPGSQPEGPGPPRLTTPGSQPEGPGPPRGGYSRAGALWLPPSAPPPPLMVLLGLRGRSPWRGGSVRIACSWAPHRNPILTPHKCRKFPPVRGRWHFRGLCTNLTWFCYECFEFWQSPHAYGLLRINTLVVTKLSSHTFLQTFENMDKQNEEPELSTEENLERDIKLYPHQRDGVDFIRSAHENGKRGVILADEMGLGKSVQVIFFLSLMFCNSNFKHVLIVMPTTLLDDWDTKLKRWCPSIKCCKYHSERDTRKTLLKIQKRRGVVLTTYGILSRRLTDLTHYKDQPFEWDCVIFDESHMLKNSHTKRYKAALMLSNKFCILISGSPIQNNVKELWTLLSLISETCLMGTYNTYRKNFENPITRGREPNAQPDERAYAQKMLECLQERINTIWLRRTKDQIQSFPEVQLPIKWEYVLWIIISPEQEDIYRSLSSIKSSSLKKIHKLRQFCSFPREFSEDMFNEIDPDLLVAASGKFTVLVPMLENLSAAGHHTLVFFQYVSSLKLVQHILEMKDWGRNSVVSIDGNLRTYERHSILKKFQSGRFSILLLTAKVGAEGLTLTAADRVIIAEPSWNQSEDAQAVDRAHRIGQEREVEVYRLITCGTVEEKMYRRQLFKNSLVRQVLGDDPNPLRPFTQEQLMDLQTLGETQFSVTQQQLEEKCQQHFTIDKTLSDHLEDLAGWDRF